MPAHGAESPAVLLALQQGLFHWRQVRTLADGAPRPGPTRVVVVALVAVTTLILIGKRALR